ncbi:histidine phosphatase superfamily [Chytridium lagenaria]|nr:histidine phosphatase superfamily [Chytridium lagenaria]
MAFPPQTPSPSETIKIKRLYLIRHGATEANTAGILQGRGIDLNLSASGRKQAEILAERFRDITVDALVVTSLKRTAETASFIRDYHPNASYMILDNLDEISWGTWEGGPVNNDLKLMWKSWDNGDFSAKAPSGESPFDVEDRACPELYNLLNGDENNIVLALHGQILRVVLASMLFHDLRYMPNFEHSNTAVSVVDVAISSNPKDSEALKAFSEGGCLNRQSLRTSAVFPLCSPNVNHPAGVSFKVVLLNNTDHLLQLNN